MTGSVLVTIHHKEDVTVVGKKRFAIYDDCWDMLKDLQDWFGCLAWQHDDGMQLVAYFSEDKDEYFLATFYEDNK